MDHLKDDVTSYFSNVLCIWKWGLEAPIFKESKTVEINHIMRSTGPVNDFRHYSHLSAWYKAHYTCILLASILKTDDITVMRSIVEYHTARNFGRN